MKTVGEFKSAGLVFVNGDSFINGGSTRLVMTDADSVCIASHAVVHSFAWRENTGVKPKFSGFSDVELNDGTIILSYDLSKTTDFDWIVNDKINPKITKLRPSLSHKVNSHWLSDYLCGRGASSHDSSTMEEKRMDIIWQNGNDGFHYDNTNAQFESLRDIDSLIQPDELLSVSYDREQAIKDMMSIISIGEGRAMTRLIIMEACEALYDAGYRKA